MVLQISKGRISYDLILCGTGATGSQLLPFLAQLLAFTEGHTLTLIDEDIVELKNCRNQKFLSSDELKYKAEVLCRRYRNVYPNLDLRYVPHYIKEMQQLKQYVDTASYRRIPVLIGCVDNNPTRKIMGEVFKDSSELIYLDSGNGTLDRIGQVVVSAKFSKKITPSLLPECRFKTQTAYDLFEDIRNDMDSVDKATSCGYQTDKSPQNIATNVMAASTLFTILTNLIMFNTIDPGIIFFDAERSVITRRPIEIYYEEVE